MLTAYTTALPPSALPAAIGSVTLAGGPAAVAVLVAAVALAAGVIVERALARPSRRRALRLVDAASGSRRAA
jgi:hypothetical protein